MARHSRSDRPDPPSLDESLRAAIAASGWTVHRLARETGWSYLKAKRTLGNIAPTMIHRWLTGGKTISFDTAGRLARALDLELVKRE